LSNLTVAEIQDLSEFADFQKAFQAKKYYYICTSETTMICYFSVHACTVDEYAVENVLYAVHLLNYYYHTRAIWGHYCIDHYDRIKS
jgi:hypothetical protein